MQTFNFRGCKLAIPEQDWMLQDIVHTGDYEPYVMETFLKEIKQNSTVLDLGANVGAFTVVAAKVAMHVIAVEAAPENAKIVAANVALNGLANVEVVPAAVSDRLGMATFQRYAGTNKIMKPIGITAETLDQVEVTAAIPVDMIIGNHTIDVVKIDVEGMEYRALAPAKKLLKMRPVVLTEYSPKFIEEGSGVPGEQYLRLFFNSGYEAVILHRDMRKEEVGQDVEIIHRRWQDYMARNITHLDLMMKHKKRHLLW